jgi:hypothetical protein
MSVLRLRPRKEPTPTTTTDTSAAAALATLRDDLAALQREDLKWAEQETTELACVASYQSAQTQVEALERRRVAAVASRKVLGTSDEDPQALAVEVSAAEARLPPLARKAREAAGTIELIRKERAGVAERYAKLGQEVRPARHAAAVEALGNAMGPLVAAEIAYVSALVAAYSFAAVIDDLARQPGPQLAFAGLLPLQDLVLPRPAHHDFLAIPSPRRETIGTALVDGIKQAEAEL